MSETTLKAKYSLGQEVVGLRKRATKRRVKCALCKCTGEVEIGGEKFVCPKCDGRSKHDQFAGDKWFAEVFGRIGSIEARIILPEYAQRHDYAESEVQYMIDCTGVISGTNWNECDVWPSIEEALAECDRRNLGTNWRDE